MTRISKQARKRAISPRKHKSASVKTGPKKNNLPLGYKVHENAASAEHAFFIPKIK